MLCGAILQIPQRGADRGLRVGDFRALRAGAQGGEHLRGVACAEGLAQRGDVVRGVRVIGRGGVEGVADVKPIDGLTALGTKWDLRLVGDLRGTVADGVNLGVQAPRGGVDALRPAQASVGDVTERGRIVGGGGVVLLRRHGRPRLRPRGGTVGGGGAVLGAAVSRASCQ